MTELKNTITERRRITRGSIYHYLYESNSARSKQDIAQALALSLPTVHQNITELMEAGLVRYSGMQQSTGGRRAKCFSIDPIARYAIGVSITGGHLRFLAADLNMRAIAYKRITRPAFQKTLNIGDMIFQELERFLEENKLERERLLGVGVAVPAVIDMDHQTIVLAPTLQLQDRSLQSIREKLPYPCYVENDGTCGGHAEWFMHKEKQNLAYLSLEDGVGGAVLIGGAPYLGSNQRSGEFGHICVEPGGRACKCGKKGCLEAYCSAQRLSGDLGITLDTFFARLQQKDIECQAIWEEFERHLVIGINSIRMTLDCDVVLGGFLSQYLSPFLPELRRRAAECNPFETKADYIRLCEDPRYAVVRGAALHFIHAFLESI